MITNEQAAKMFEQPTIEAVPTDMKRIIIPAYGFAAILTPEASVVSLSSVTSPLTVTR